MVVVSYSSLPFADGWTPIAAAASGVKLLSFNWLAHQHNEHRLVIPKLLLITDLRFFQYRQVFLLADHSKAGKVSFACAGQLRRINVLITDKQIDCKFAGQLRKQGVEVVRT
jgi:hypothetical protein